jgi:hypothetical protein
MNGTTPCHRLRILLGCQSGNSVYEPNFVIDRAQGCRRYLQPANLRELHRNSVREASAPVFDARIGLRQRAIRPCHAGNDGRRRAFLLARMDQASIEHLVIAAVIAPFLLLRTVSAAELTIRTIDRIDQWASRPLTSFLFAPAVKVICTTLYFCRHPIKCILRIPANFYTYVFVLDSATAPELIPILGLELRLHGAWYEKDLFRSDLAKQFTIRQMRRRYSYARRASVSKVHMTRLYIIVTIDHVISSLTLSILTLFSLAFRWSIKSTILIWLPLLWVIRQSLPGTSVLDHIRVIVREPWFKVVLGYSSLVIVGVSAKLMLILSEWDLLQPFFWRLGPIGLLFNRLIEPHRMPLWHITSAVNGALSWAFYFRGSRHLIAAYSTDAWPDRWIRWEYVGFQTVRTTFSLYAITCSLYIAVTTAWTIDWTFLQLIHFIVFPHSHWCTESVIQYPPPARTGWPAGQPRGSGTWDSPE